MKVSTLVGVAMLATICATPSRANFIPQMSLQSQLIAADLALVGRLGEPTACVIERQSEPCAEIQADVVLKGSPATFGIRYLLLRPMGISESSVEGMAPSGTVLMFLQATRPQGPQSNLLTARPEYYTAVQAYRSILPVNDQNLR
jgi:hypothetical protein